MFKGIHLISVVLGFDDDGGVMCSQGLKGELLFLELEFGVIEKLLNKSLHLAMQYAYVSAQFSTEAKKRHFRLMILSVSIHFREELNPPLNHAPNIFNNGGSITVRLLPTASSFLLLHISFPSQILQPPANRLPNPPHNRPPIPFESTGVQNFCQNLRQVWPHPAPPPGIPPCHLGLLPFRRPGMLHQERHCFC
ncbi:hypothetical protein L2E82_27186 [Cichorium intybus]|uniref:Uncharacterized protein n=1 Tax=Cichorium intybus TaxID=13427 RepID=A0ACB9CSF1_CICIN|nr:hypothetical protein L2E82_27186 [Cichorium intybus]